jgi:riboflavin kinase/FMN adenylyltransferase
VVTLGNFDGVHLGHQALIAEARALAAQVGGPSAALTFDPAPRDVLRPDNPIPRIQGLAERVSCLRAAGLDAVVVEPFTLALAALEPEDFVRRVLVEGLGVQGVVVGFNFRFGRARAGDATTLAASLGAPVVCVEPVSLLGGAVSSSRVREAIRTGDVALAAALLGRAHRVAGPVVHGDARGRALGYRTANVSPEEGLLPAHGVYAVWLEVAGVRRPGVANLGVRPTFGGGEPRLEVHLLDGEAALYAARVRVDWVARIREERAFEGPEALVAQIQADVAAARVALALP